MKKSGKLLTSLFLFSSVLLSPVTTIANAEGTSATESSSTKPSSTESSSTKASSTAPSSTESSSTGPSSTAPSSTEPSSTAPSSTEPSSTKPSSTEPSSTEPSDAIAIATAKADLKVKVANAKNYLDYDKYTTESLLYLENFILYAEKILANPDATLDEVNNAIDMINAAVDAVKTLPRDSDKKITINATNQTMFIGDVLTKETILGWANIENGEGLYLQAEIIGNPLMVNKFTNQLVETGTYTIRYTIKSTDFDGNPLRLQSTSVDPKMTVTSKDITLTVLNREPAPTPATPATPATPILTPTNTDKPVTAPKATAKLTKEKKKNLPETGEKETNMALSTIGLTLIASVYFMKKRKENDFDLN